MKIFVYCLDHVQNNATQILRLSISQIIGNNGIFHGCCSVDKVAYATFPAFPSTSLGSFEEFHVYGNSVDAGVLKVFSLVVINEGACNAEYYSSTAVLRDTDYWWKSARLGRSLKKQDFSGSVVHTKKEDKILIFWDYMQNS